MNKRTCGMPGCSNPHLAQNRCGVHYAAGRKTGEVQVLPEKPGHRISDLDRESRTGTCEICGPVEVFFTDKRPDPRCAIKARAAGKKRRALLKSADKWPKTLAYHRHYARRRKFRLPKDGVERLLDRVAHKCEICAEPLTVESARIDHDHACCDEPDKPTCGFCVRGILCQSCNTGIGMMKDDAARLAAAAKYLNERTGFPFGRIA